MAPWEVTAPRLGMRKFAASHHWEGVVEEITDRGFRGRLIPFASGQPDESQIEFAEFSFDDLQDESERSLVAVDAVFYWTIGVSRSSAGTRTNRSLVRFRRLPPTTGYWSREAAKRAKELLEELGVEHPADAPGS